MFNNELIDLRHEVQGRLWVDKINKAHQRGDLCPWVTTFHPQKLACRLEGSFYNGSFNAGVKMVFSDGDAWMVRFPRVGKIDDAYADEKVAMEVRALGLIRARTTIPVPTVRAWGGAADNMLGLGAFVMMDFIDGVCLNDLWTEPNEVEPTRLMREDLCDADIEAVYRQFARFQLQLFRLDFDGIGSLPPLEEERDKSPILMPKRPLTYKAHDILYNGGVDVFGDRSQGFATTTDYFQYLFRQDVAQLTHQPNSVYGPKDGRNKYLSFKVLGSLLPDLVHPTYDEAPCKLICDDLGLANPIVRSKDDLTVVGVVDLEWSYCGPTQLFGSAPWWILQERPIDDHWVQHDVKNRKPPPAVIAERYFRHLDLYKRILAEEEEREAAAAAISNNVGGSGHDPHELSLLMQWSQDSGAMWLHMILSMGFNDHTSFPFMQLRRHVGEAEWDRRVADEALVGGPPPDVESFVAQKMLVLKAYNAAETVLSADKARVDAGEMTGEAFLAKSPPPEVVSGMEI